MDSFLKTTASSTFCAERDLRKSSTGVDEEDRKQASAFVAQGHVSVLPRFIFLLIFVVKTPFLCHMNNLLNNIETKQTDVVAATDKPNLYQRRLSHPSPKMLVKGHCFPQLSVGGTGVLP